MSDQPMLKIVFMDGTEEVFHYVDRTTKHDGVLTVFTDRYGNQPVKSFPLTNIKYWEYNKW